MQGKPAWRLLERLSAEHLADLIYQYGEERYSRRIARAIVQQRQEKPIETAAAIGRTRAAVRSAAAKRSASTRRRGPFRPCGLPSTTSSSRWKSPCAGCRTVLRPGGRLAVISFHSLEDRRVKEAFRDDPRLTPLSRKPIVASDEEIAANPRSRSAKLRVAARN